MNYIEAPNYPEVFTKRDTNIFLAGSISGCWDWQTYVRLYLRDNAFKYNVFNPRRATFDTSKKEESEVQINWEYEMLKYCGYVAFWFSYETFAPITLFEYGTLLNSDVKLIVGCDPMYPRVNDVKIQTALRRPGLKIHNDLGDFSKEIVLTFKTKVVN